MTEPLAPAVPVDLTRLEELEQSATPGPWCADAAAVLAGDDGARLAAFNAAPDGTPWPDDITEIANLAAQAEDADAEFIAALRNAAPQLLAASRAVERVRALADVVRDLQPADPDTGDRDVSWLALLEAIEGGDE